MRRTLFALAALLVLAALAAAALSPGQPEPAANPAGTGAGQGEACTSCTLHHQRLGEPKD